jgi:hypothetical protein
MPFSGYFASNFAGAAVRLAEKKSWTCHLTPNGN